MPILGVQLAGQLAAHALFGLRTGGHAPAGLPVDALQGSTPELAAAPVAVREGRLRLTPPVRRGAFRALPQPVAFAVVLGTVAVGWLMPVLGASLLVVLAGDALAVSLSRRKAARSA